MGLCSCFKLSNAYLHIGNKHYLIKMKSDLFKKSLFLQRNATYWNGILILFLLSKCYTFWMKVSVCKACTCQLELLLEKTYSCLIVFCGKIIYSVFTAFFQVWGKGRKLRLFSCRGCPYRNIAFSWFCFGSRNANWGPEKNFFNPESWIEDWRLNMFFFPAFNLQSSLLDWRSFFPAFNLQFSKEYFSQPSIFNFQKKFFSPPSIFNPASWIEEVFSQPSIFNFHKKFSSPPSMFNLQSSLLDWRSFFPAFNLQFSKEVFSPPSIFNLQSSLLDWKSFFPAFNLQFSKEVFSQPSIFNFQKKFFPSLQSSIFNPASWIEEVFSQPSMFNPASWIEEVFAPAFNLQFSKEVFSQPSIFNFQKKFFPSLQSSIFNPASWIEEVFSQPSIFNFHKTFFPSLPSSIFIEAGLKKFFPSLQSSIFKSFFFPAFNLQFQKTFFPSLQSSIFNPASWIEEVFSQPSIFNFHKKFSSPPSIFNLQSSLLDWRSFFPAFNLQFSKEVFSQPSIFNFLKNVFPSLQASIFKRSFFPAFNLQSSLLDWRIFFPAFNLQFSKVFFSQPSIFNLQSSLLDWRSFFPAFNLQSSIQPPGLKKFFPSLQSSIFNPASWIEDFFSQPSMFNLQSSLLDWRSFFPSLQSSIFKRFFFPAFNVQSSIQPPGLKKFFPSLQSSIFNPGGWTQEPFANVCKCLEQNLP